MPDMTTIVAMIQAKTQVTDADYAKTIVPVIESIWAGIADSCEWWFMGQPTPKEFTLYADADTYTFKDNNIGRLLYIANSTGVPYMVYLSRQDWMKVRASSAQALDGYPMFFYKSGRGEDGGMVIRLGALPSPGSAGQKAYLFYQEAASAANIDALPLSGLPCLIHGVMSLLAPPKEVPVNKTYTRWDALCYKEYEMFQDELDRFIRREGKVETQSPQLSFSSEIADGLSDAMDVQR